MSDIAIKLAVKGTAEVNAALNQLQGRLGDFKRTLVSLAGGFTLGATLRQMSQAADEMANTNARLKLVTKSSADFASVQGELIKLSRESRTSLQANADLYVSMARATDGLGVSQDRLLGLVDGISKAFVVSGAGAAEMNGSLRQLAQALQSGVLRGDEFNSMMEGAPRLMQAVADGMGVHTGRLRDMAKAGLLTVDRVLPAMEKGLKKVNEEFATMPVTVGQAWQVFTDSFTIFSSKASEASNANKTLATAILTVSKALDWLGDNLGTIGALLTTGAVAVGTVALIANFGAVAATIGVAAKAAVGFIAAMGPIGWAITAVTALTAAYMVFKDEIEGTGAHAMRLGDMFSVAFDMATGGADKAADAARKTGEAQAKAAKDTVGGWERSILAVAGFLDGLDSAFNGFARGVGQAFIALGQVIKNAFAVAFNAVAEMAEKTLNGIADRYNSLPFLPGRIGTASFGRMGVSGAQGLDDIGAAFRSGRAAGQTSAATDLAQTYIAAVKARGAMNDLASAAGGAGNRMKDAGDKGDKAGKKAAEAAKKAREEFDKLLAGLTNKDSGLSADFHEKLNKLYEGFTKGWFADGIDGYREAVTALINEQKFAQDITKANQDAYEELIKTLADAQKLEADQLKSAREMLENLQFETAALRMTNAEREVAIALRDLERQGIVEGTEAYRAYAEQIREAVLNKDAVETSIAAQQEINDGWQKTTDQIAQSFTDKLMEGGRSVRDYLKSLFRTLVLRPILQPIAMGISGGIMSLMGGTAMAGQGGGGILGGILGSFGGGAIGSQFGSLLGLGNLGAGLKAGLGAIVGEAGMLGGINAGWTSMMAGNVGGGIGTMLGAAAPVLLPLAALFASGAFSRKHAQHNLEGTFGGATGFEGNWHDYYKGGLFRSSKTVNTDLDSATLNALRAAWKAQEAAITDYAKVLGLSTENIEGFTYRINLKLKDLGDPSDAGYMDKVWQMVNEAISKGSNEMAERILGTWTTTTREVEETIKTGFWDDETFTTVKKTVEETTYAASEYAREGERAIDTLTRLATSLQATNAAFDMLGLSLYEASLAGGDMASKLIDQMGGMDAFGAQVSAYWQNYYTEAERHAYMTVKMTEALAAAGLEMPTTVAGFRALVDAQDLTTDAGRAAFTALMSVNAAFTEVYGNADAAAGSIADLGDELAALEPIVFGAASDLASVIEQGLLGTLTGAQLGEQMADVVMQGMYSAIAGGFSQQITALMVEGVLNPMIAAAMTGASMSAAVSQAAIDRVIQHAQAAAAAINAVLSDPGFQAAIQQVQAAVGSISVGIQRPEPIYDSYAAQNARALAAQREAERMADEAQRAADQRAREAQQLAEQQAREAQRLADEEARYWQAVYSERQGLLKQLWTLEGNVAAVRQMELEALDPSNRALQTRIWQLQDEKEAVDRYNVALKNAQEFLSGFTRNITEFIFKVSHAQATAAEGYQLAAAKFSAQLVLARGGDRDALGSITGYADTLIESIRRESATGAEANLRIARVLGQLGELPQQVSAEQLIVDAIASGTSTTVNALSNLQSSLINELIGGFDQIDATMDGKLSFSELQTALADKATDAEIAALIARVDTNSDGQISKLEAVRAAAATTATNVGTVNTSVGTVNTSVGTWGSNQWDRLGTVNSSVGYWGNAQTNATNSILAYQSVQTAGTYADFRADYQYIRESVDDVYDAIRAMHFTDGTNSIMRMRAQVDEVRNNSYPLYVKSEHRAGTMMTFETGGYTGHGGRFEPAGIVHRGEGVLNQDDIRALGGPAGFEALRLSLKRGYADGGLVAPVPFVAPILRQGSDPEIKRLLRELVDEARAKESNDRVRHSTLLNQASRQTEIMERQENIGMPRTRKENAVVV